MKARIPIAALALLACATLQAQTRVTALLWSGDAGMRRGDSASLQFTLVDGRSTAEQALVSGLDSRSSTRVTLTFPETFSLGQVGTIRIRYAGGASWDLARLKINGLYDSWSDPESDLLARFDAARDRLAIKLRDGDPDFVVRGIERVAGIGYAVRVANIGVDTGRLQAIECRSALHARQLPTGRLLLAGGAQRFVLEFPPVGSVRGRPPYVVCTARGTSLDGRPEALTANNAMTLWL